MTGTTSKGNHFTWIVTKLNEHNVMLVEKNKSNIQIAKNFWEMPGFDDSVSKLELAPPKIDKITTIPFNNTQLVSFFQKAPVGIHCTGGLFSSLFCTRCVCYPYVVFWLFCLSLQLMVMCFGRTSIC